MNSITEAESKDPRFILRTMEDEGVRKIIAKTIDYLMIFIIPVLLVTFVFKEIPIIVLGFLVTFLMSWIMYHIIISACDAVSFGFYLLGIRYVDTKSCSLIRGDKYFSLLEAKIYFFFRYGSIYEIKGNLNKQSINYSSVIVVNYKEYKLFQKQYMRLGRLIVKSESVVERVSKY